MGGDSGGGERKLATVLFADLVGSTELGGPQDPERTRALLERFYDTAADEEILAGGRTVTAAQGAFEFGDERMIEAKGKPGGVRRRSLLRALSLMRARGLGGLQPAFVGRDRELSATPARSSCARSRAATAGTRTRRAAWGSRRTRSSSKASVSRSTPCAQARAR